MNLLQYSGWDVLTLSLFGALAGSILTGVTLLVLWSYGVFDGNRRVRRY